MGETNTRLGLVSPRMVVGLWLSTTPVALSCAPPMILTFAPLVKFRSIGRPDQIDVVRYRANCWFSIDISQIVGQSYSKKQSDLTHGLNGCATLLLMIPNSAWFRGRI
mgnify:CR=1 FL=1